MAGRRACNVDNHCSTSLTFKIYKAVFFNLF
jgi:hypothetical protein